jgi:hypothetical protein
MKAKHTSLVLSTLLAALISSSALAVTQVEAHAQLDQIPATQSRAAAHEVLDTLVSSGVSVDSALAVVTDAVSQNVDAGQLRQMGTEIRTRVEQNVSVEQAYAQVKTEFTGTATAGGTNANSGETAAIRTVTTEGSQGARAGEAKGSVQASVNVQAETNQRGSISGNPGAAPGMAAPAVAVNLAMAMNPGMAGMPPMVANPNVPGSHGATGNPGASANFGAAGNARMGGNPR